MSCDLLKIHYLCGDKDNLKEAEQFTSVVVICSKFITFAVTKTTHLSLLTEDFWIFESFLYLFIKRFQAIKHATGPPIP